MRLLLLTTIMVFVFFYVLWVGRFTSAWQTIALIMVLAVVFVVVLASLRAAARAGW